MSKRESDAEGILKCGPMCWSIVLPCNTNMVLIWLYTVAKTMPEAQIGSTRMMDLSSSTWVTVHSLHGLGWSLIRSVCVSTAALSKNLSEAQLLAHERSIYLLCSPPEVSKITCALEAWHPGTI